MTRVFEDKLAEPEVVPDVPPEFHREMFAGPDVVPPTLRELREAEEAAALERHKVEFLDHLTHLTRVYALKIAGCGCCDSPHLDLLATDEHAGGYTIDSHGIICWETKGPALSCCSFGVTKGYTVAAPCWVCRDEKSEKLNRALPPEKQRD